MAATDNTDHSTLPRTPEPAGASLPEPPWGCWIEDELGLVEKTMLEVLKDAAPSPAHAAATYHLSTGGSRLRARIALASGRAWGTPKAYRVASAAACELLHNASLIHDDLSDGDTTRRGQAAVWVRFGRDVALCAGDCMLTSAFAAAATIDHAKAAQKLLQRLAQLTQRAVGGQSLELAGRLSPRPSFSAYLHATRGKTAPLLLLPLETGTFFHGSPACELMTELAEAMGLAYQILDDLDDVEPGLARSGSAGLHPYHALPNHRSHVPGHKHGHAYAAVCDIRARYRALRHARAALNRAATITLRLPSPLITFMDRLLRNLADKAQRHAIVGLHARSREGQ